MSESSFLLEKRWLNQKAFRSTNYFTTHDPSKEIVSRGCLKIGKKQWGIRGTYLLYSHAHVNFGNWLCVCSFVGGPGSHPSGRFRRGLGNTLRTCILRSLIVFKNHKIVASEVITFNTLYKVGEKSILSFTV